MSEELRDLINQEGKTIWIYLSKSIKQDPEEEDTKEVVQNSIPIKALVTDLTSAQMSWKAPGISETQGKELILDSKWINTIKQAYKIVIDDNTYVGWKDSSGRTQIRQEGDYIRIYIYRK